MKVRQMIMTSDDNQEPIIIHIRSRLVQDVEWPAGCTRPIVVRNYDIDAVYADGRNHAGMPYLDEVFYYETRTEN